MLIRIVTALHLFLYASLVESTTVTVTGVAMDVYCIDEGDMIDNGKETLKFAHEHTIHCLVDVTRCVDSGYEILVLNDSGGYDRAVVLDDFGNSEVLRLARSVGVCSTCDGQGNQVKNFVVTAEGELVDATEIGDSSEPPPLMKVTSMSVGAVSESTPVPTTVPPTMDPTVPEPPPTLAPTISPPVTMEPTPMEPPPTMAPTGNTISPVTVAPTGASTQIDDEPTASPTKTIVASSSPSEVPSGAPLFPSSIPSESPSDSPSISNVPSQPFAPSEISSVPSSSPSGMPSSSGGVPSESPSDVPSVSNNVPSQSFAPSGMPSTSSDAPGQILVCGVALSLSVLTLFLLV